MSVRVPVGLLAVFAMAVMVLGGCGTDETDGDKVRLPAAPTSAATATEVPTPSPTSAATATATPSPMPTAMPAPTQEVDASGPRVLIGDASFAVEVARTQEERNRGLSYRESLAPSTGMLFVFEPAVAGAFWMRGMKFPLDFIWIDRRCEVVDLTLNAPAPAPGTPDSELPIYEIDAVASYTLEVNAGEVERYNIQVGDEVGFSGVEVEGGGC